MLRTRTHALGSGKGLSGSRLCPRGGWGVLPEAAGPWRGRRRASAWLPKRGAGRSACLPACLPARLGCLARDLAALTRRHQEAECRAWRFARENEELRTELGQARALLQEAQAGRLALEARWLREKALEATRVNRAIEQEEK